MEIRGVFMGRTIAASEQLLPLQQGQLYDAAIKEVKDGEAVVNIKGTDVRVRTEGEWPKEGRATIKIVGEQDGLPVARIVVRPQQEAASRTARPAAFETLPPELKQIESWMQQQGKTLTKETVSTLQTFFAEAAGTIEQKLDTVRAVMNKKLELTSPHLAAVHEALHGQPFGERLVAIANKLDPTFTLAIQEQQSVAEEGAFGRGIGATADVSGGIEKPQQTSEQVLSQHLDALLLEQRAEDMGGEKRFVFSPTPSGATDNVDNFVQRLEQLHEALCWAIKLLKQEPHLEKALSAVQTEIGEAIGDHSHRGKTLAEALAKAREFVEEGREFAARKTVLETLNEMEASLSSPTNDRPVNADRLFDYAWQTGLPLETKDVLVQTVTKKMAQAVRDFQTVKRDVMRQLEIVLKLEETSGPAARMQVKSMLETAIKQLDNAILKSDIMLFTDMTTEKQLMKASSELNEAKKRLQQGDAAGARKIVSDVKNMLSTLMFKPSDVKVKHFVAVQNRMQLDPSKEFLDQVNQVMRPPTDGPSARHLFDTIRRLGLTHEYEVAESLLLNGNEDKAAPINMKEALLRLAQSRNESVARQAEQVLTNLTGQQLLNKWDGATGVQSFFFSLPLLWQNEVRNVNVYVNAHQDGERINWENCRLYFLLETKKLGDLGILLQANERNLSITFRNDRDDFAEKAAPFINMAKERLEEIGYRVISVNVTKLTNETKRQEEEKRAPSARSSAPFTERGYDFTI
ncbi:hypothetical protein LG52_3237 [Geobacillus kaustophilus]|uniref:Flagellar hook-length control protein-like C-terminal domain-containing protein n=1 Tax=Geobacillus kaustophilus TaxID=1462 RepID=A0A0D8BU26_GEOKU|nr:hypothetical protein [Geobacillus kaustophilus]KJE27681.1 hypothetical protein LG52_3237 [Geobacillus kaustophilus]